VLDDPISLANGLNLRNRLVVAPMTTYSSYEDGRIREDELPYLRRRAEGGFGIVMTAACAVHPRGKAFDGQWVCWEDTFMDSLISAADAIHDGGAAAVLQIHHGGRQCPSRICGGPPLSASAIPSERPNAETPVAMTDEEIEETIYAFSMAALRAQAAGYDAVEIHGANTYLLQQFVSPHSNRRDDEWGQDRLAFPLAVVDSIMQTVPGYPVGYRFSPEESENPGIRLEDTFKLIDGLCTFDLSFLHISLGNFRQGSIRGDYEAPTLTRVLEHIDGRLPLIGVGSVKTHADYDEIRAMGADLVALGRVAITEPEWPKVRSPRLSIPASNAADVLTVPEGLTNKIYAVKGWFPVDEA
jgi:2,4-dienoyl-CoA reductase-like NADH-dependent reductase (Old Yellow Enzyme family)